MKEVIQTQQAPEAIGPYSQAIRIEARQFVFCSGQIPMDPDTGEIVGTTAEEQCTRVMENMKAVLRASGLGFAQVIKTTIYLANMDDFATVNEVYAKYFEENFPARATVQVARLPKNVLLEIEAIAAL